MVRIKVDSSSITEVGYSYTTKELQIKFTRGVVFSYANVPEHEVFNLLFGKSVGSYFAMNIKDKYECRKVE